ncbi:MAG: NFACT family protein [Bacillota bacterium]|nr:NFACT family protein [Bacillota bacterium]
MPFDALVMAAVRREIEEVLPARVDRVYTVARRHQTPSEVVLVLFRPGIRTQVLVSLHPRFARVHLSYREQPAAAPTPFVQVLRKHLEGAHLVAAEQIDRDRVLILHFRTALGTSPRLAVEIMGPGSNLVLIDGEGRIVDAWRQEGPRPDRTRRILLPGVPYEPPAPPASGAWGPFSAREIAARVGSTSDHQAPPAGATRGASEVADGLWEEAGVRPRPVVITDADGRPRDYWCLVPVAHGPVAREYPTMSRLLDDFYEDVQAGEELSAWRDRLGRILSRRRERQARLVESLREDLERARAALRYRTWGELLLAQAAHLPAGHDRIEVTDYYQEEPRPLEIPLDPALSARQNAQEYFRRYTKARRSLEPLKTRLDSESTRLAYLEQLEEALGRAADRDTLEVLEQEMLSAGIPSVEQGDRAPGTHAAARTGAHLASGSQRGGVARAGDRRGAHGGAGARTPHPVAAHRVLRFSLPGGEEVMVGTGAEANDFVTFVLGRPDDIWMHARGVPGSHVLLRPPPGRAASPEAMVRAASVAAYFSHLRRSAKAEVDWTLRKHVRRRPGGGPGQVLYREEHTLLVEPAPPPRPEASRG